VPLPARPVRLLLVAALLAAAVGAAATAACAAETRSTAAGTGFQRGTVELRKRDGGAVRLSVELARTSAQRSQGLMDRRSLPPRHGMLFLFPGRTHSGFWMKNTLIPLSIAFIGSDGRIQQLMDMEPCRADPCRVYVPRRPYVRALEVNRGAFRRWGVRVGDRVVLLRRSP
jgi:uncharacterized protein